ncbi:MAG: hypothetical protein ACOYBC_07420 [Bilifractor sp.]|jgi:uncharacterized membrane protein (DUF373 family)
MNQTGKRGPEHSEKEERLNVSVKRIAHIIERIVEGIMAIIVITAVIISIVHLIPMIGQLADAPFGSGKLEEFLGYVLDIVIGVEFFRLLAAPDLKVVLEVMMFAMTRHMIVEETSAAENLLTIIGIGIIAYLQRFLNEQKRPRSIRQILRGRRTGNDTEAGKDSENPDNTGADDANF